MVVHVILVPLETSLTLNTNRVVISPPPLLFLAISSPNTTKRPTCSRPGVDANPTVSISVPFCCHVSKATFIPVQVNSTPVFWQILCPDMTSTELVKLNEMVEDPWPEAAIEQVIKCSYIIVSCWFCQALNLRDRELLASYIKGGSR